MRKIVTAILALVFIGNAGAQDAFLDMLNNRSFDKEAILRQYPNNTPSPADDGGDDAEKPPTRLSKDQVFREIDFSLPPGSSVLAGGADTLALILPTQAPGVVGAVARSFHRGCLQGLQTSDFAARVDVYDTDGAAHSVVAAYTRAAEQADLLIGPMQKGGVTAVLEKFPQAPTPTLLLQPGRGRDYFILTVDLEEEIKQLARLIKDGGYRVLLVTDRSPLSARQVRAFTAIWQDKRHQLEFFTVQNAEHDWQRLFEKLKDAREEQAEAGAPKNQPPLAVFAAGNEKFVRQTRYFVPQGYAVFASSLLYAHAAQEGAVFLESLRVMEMPWFFPAQDWRQFETPLIRSRSVLEQRYFALGVDACRVAQKAPEWFEGWVYDGISGYLQLSGALFERRGVLAQYEAGVLTPLSKP